MSSARYVLPHLKQVWNFSANLIKIPNIKFHVNMLGETRDDKRGVNKSLIQLHSRKMLLWRFNFAGNNKDNVGHHLKDPVFCSILIKFGCSLQVS